MQNAHCELKEIIWEITDNCNQGCSYCGSKDIINKTPIDLKKIYHISKEISEYSPDEINISGGNPLLVPFEVYSNVIKMFKNVGITCKLIMNPFNIVNKDSENTIELFDWIGLSVNTPSELFAAKKFNHLHKTTIITNFNKQNIFNFKDIEKFVIEFNGAFFISQGYIDSVEYYFMFQETEAGFERLKIPADSTIIKEGYSIVFREVDYK